jgi:hypothetical protein
MKTSPSYQRWTFGRIEPANLFIRTTKEVRSFGLGSVTAPYDPENEDHGMRFRACRVPMSLRACQFCCRLQRIQKGDESLLFYGC